MLLCFNYDLSLALHTKHIQDIQDLAALKWHVFSKQQLDFENLTPTSEEFLRAH